MGPLLFVLALFALMSALVLYGISFNRRQDALWRSFAREWGMTLETEPVGEGLDKHALHFLMEGEVRGLRVRVEVRKTGLPAFVASYRRPGPQFSVYLGSFGAGDRKGLQLGNVPEFDERFVVKGEDHDAIRELWPPELQRRMLSFVAPPRQEWFARSVGLRQGYVDSDGKEVRVARAPTTRGEMDEALAILTGLVQDWDARVLDEERLRAAIDRGDEGREELLEIAMHREGYDPRSARAVDVLGQDLTQEQAQTILAQSLQGRHLATALAAIRVLGRIGGAAVVPPLAAALDDGDEEIVAAAVTALGGSAAEEAEDALIAALGRVPPSARPQLVEALGRVGTAAAVAPLRELASLGRFDLEVRRASRQAIAAIRSRLPAATPGQLALAEGESGQMSLADEDAEGRVSLGPELLTDRTDGSGVDGEDGPSSVTEPPPRRREKE